ncbi:MAG: DUF1080 domain-containing protein, partial [Gemmataceae bacterium]|nr:DUF1080 domain-containing protein [Gemmataceae bacterium]
MPRVFLFLLAVAVGGPAPADEPTVPSLIDADYPPVLDTDRSDALLPAAVREGWVNLFDGESLFGWEPDDRATAAVRDGRLVLTGGEKGGYLWHAARFPEDLEMVAVWQATGPVRFVSRVGPCHASIGVDHDGRPYTAARSARSGRAFTVTSASRVKPGIWATSGDGGLVRDCPPGTMRLGFELPKGSQVTVTRLAVRPTGAKPLFDGKGLSGWKMFAGDPKRMASKAEVTAAGELALKNGPGDLQTEGQYADFVLQLECKTNGKGLNSGVFFRCLPGQYQQGYEAQIQNSYLGDDRTKPVDFGTGAIYRRVPARKVVSSDDEWFTLTVVADGPRISTWVNGYPTVSWLDDRKPADNARQG